MSYPRANFGDLGLGTTHVLTDLKPGSLTTPFSAITSGRGGSGYDYDDLLGAGESKSGILRPMTVLIVIIAILVIILISWFVFFRKKYTILEFIMLPFKWIINFASKLIGRLFGFSDGDIGIDVGIPPITIPGVKEPPLPGSGAGGASEIIIQQPNVEVTKHVITDCPPCNCDCNCPKCEECDHRPYELEIKYLKDMVRFLGSIGMRENAINAQFRELHPGFTVNSPHVRQLSVEYNYIKNQIRKDKNKWQYFKNYFSKLSGIPSTSTAIHHDLLL